MSEPPPQEHGPEGARSRPLILHIGHNELVVRKRWEAASIGNDILIAVWFVVGSVMFFSEKWTTPGTWCFLIGSIELLIRPVIRLSRHIHLGRLRDRTGQSPEVAVTHELTQDF